MYAKSEGGAIAYQVLGEGPDVLFVPNWLQNLEIQWDDPSYARYLERLASFSRLICFDERGGGLSEALPLASLPTLEQWMGDILAVMDAGFGSAAARFGAEDGAE